MNAPKTFEEYRVTRKAHHDAVQATSTALLHFPRLPNGLTPDAIKLSPEFKTAKAAFNTAFAASRAFHGAYTKLFKNDLRDERRAKRNGF